jgi:hypothetical protein
LARWLAQERSANATAKACDRMIGMFGKHLTVIDSDYNAWHRLATYAYDLPDDIKSAADAIGWDPARAVSQASVEPAWREFLRYYGSAIVWHLRPQWRAVLGDCDPAVLGQLEREVDFLAVHGDQLLGLRENIRVGFPDGREWTIGSIDLMLCAACTIGHFDKMSPVWVLERGLSDA